MQSYHHPVVPPCNSVVVSCLLGCLLAFVCLPHSNFMMYMACVYLAVPGMTVYGMYMRSVEYVQEWRETCLIKAIVTFQYRNGVLLGCICMPLKYSWHVFVLLVGWSCRQCHEVQWLLLIGNWNLWITINDSLVSALLYVQVKMCQALWCYVMCYVCVGANIVVHVFSGPLGLGQVITEILEMLDIQFLLYAVLYGN